MTVASALNVDDWIMVDAADGRGSRARQIRSVVDHPERGMVAFTLVGDPPADTPAARIIYVAPDTEFLAAPGPEVEPS